MISVIVPVYNVEPFLKKCVDSIINQTYRNIEIILIDDGSPDTCGQICDEYAKTDSRFTVIHQENQGLAETRNIGIEHALSPYIMFVDSDDWVTADFCEQAYQLIVQRDVDIVFFGFTKLKNGKVMKNPFPNKPEGYKTKKEAIELILSNSGNFVWNKIYRKELFEGIRYPKGRFYEDVAVTHKLVLKATKIWYSHKRMYYYRYREGSIVTTRSQKRKDDAFEMTMEQIKTLRSIEEMRTIANEMVLVLYFSYCISYEKDTSDERYCLTEKTIMALKPNIPQFFSRKQKIALILFWYCRPLFDFVCRLFNKRI